MNSLASRLIACAVVGMCQAPAVAGQYDPLTSLCGMVDGVEQCVPGVDKDIEMKLTPRGNFLCVFIEGAWRCPGHDAPVNK